MISFIDLFLSFMSGLGGAGVAVAGAWWFFSTAVKARLDKDLESHKAGLKSESDSEIERLKGSLQLAALEHQVRFSRLHEKRAEVIEEIYLMLLSVSESARAFVVRYDLHQPGQYEEFKKEHKRLLDFSDLVEKRQIYLPEGICASLNAYGQTIQRPLVEFGVFGAIVNPDLPPIAQPVITGVSRV